MAVEFPMAGKNAKLKEALEHVRLAEKSLKTSWMKWNPDYEIAASEYTKAATSFKLGACPERAKDAYVKAADMQLKVNALFHSAKLLTQAGSIASDLGNFEEAIHLMDLACSRYREHGSPDTAAATLVKAGKMCELKAPSQAVEMYLKAAELCETDDKPRDASDHLNQAVRLELKQSNFMSAVELMNKRLHLCSALGQFNLGYSIILSQVIACLAAGDREAAEKHFQDGFKVSEFGMSDEAGHAEHFIQAFCDGNEELLKSTRTQPTVLHLDTEIARVARNLKLREDMRGSSAQPLPSASGKSELEEFEDAADDAEPSSEGTSAAGNAAEHVEQAADEDDEDDFN